MVTTKVVVARAGYDLDSKKVADIPEDAKVVVHDAMPLGELMRARVLVKATNVECWVTMTNKEGISFLIPPPIGAANLSQTAIEEARKVFSVFDADGDGSLSTAELKEILTRPGGGQPMTMEEVESIIAIFDVDGDGELQLEEFAVMWAGTQLQAAPPAEASAAPVPAAASTSEEGVKPDLTRSKSSAKLFGMSFHQKVCDARDAVGCGGTWTVPLLLPRLQPPCRCGRCCGLLAHADAVPPCESQTLCESPASATERRVLCRQAWQGQEHLLLSKGAEACQGRRQGRQGRQEREECAGRRYHHRDDGGGLRLGAGRHAAQGHATQGRSGRPGARKERQRRRI